MTEYAFKGAKHHPLTDDYDIGRQLGTYGAEIAFLGGLPIFVVALSLFFHLDCEILNCALLCMLSAMSCASIFRVWCSWNREIRWTFAGRLQSSHPNVDFGLRWCLGSVICFGALVAWSIAD